MSISFCNAPTALSAAFPHRKQSAESDHILGHDFLSSSVGVVFSLGVVVFFFGIFKVSISVQKQSISGRKEWMAIRQSASYVNPSSLSICAGTESRMALSAP
jgi:hypothetical protein